MLPPPPRPHCAFGPACASQPNGQPNGPSICNYCKNLSFAALYQQANDHPDSRSLKRLINASFHQLERDRTERTTKGWSHLCATKDPTHSFDAWRRDFNPQSPRACGTVRHPSQLCTRCYATAREQRCTWLSEWNGDRMDFPCVWEDPRLRRPADINWKRGPLDEQGEPDPSWEKDVRRYGRCGRAKKRNQLCQGCFNRMCEIRGFGRYFDGDWGVLRDGYGFR
jgi:hypothetical protein